jgi:diguanylate cyclase (GGDEF)-like protein
VPDASLDPRFMDNDLVTSGPKLRFYAGCALRAADGTGLGAICVLDSKPRPQGLTATERSTLEVLARQVEGQLELRVALSDGEAQVAALQNLTRELAYRGSHDALTELPNRNLFAAKLKAGLEKCDREGTSLSLMILDVDHFKQTNDSLGHDAGDALLSGLAANLASVTREADTVARLGGDEFAIILTDVAADGPDPAVVESLIERIGRPVLHRGRMIECRTSIGIATYRRTPQVATR